MAAPDRWQAVDRDGLHFRNWDDEWVVYSDLSGHTHLLSSLAGHLILLLSRQGAPITVEALASVIAAEEAAECNHDLIDAIAAILTDFERLNLVERAQT